MRFTQATILQRLVNILMLSLNSLRLNNDKLSNCKRSQSRFEKEEKENSKCVVVPKGLFRLFVFSARIIQRTMTTVTCTPTAPYFVQHNGNYYFPTNTQAEKHHIKAPAKDEK